MPYSLAGTATAINTKKPSKNPQLSSPKLTFWGRTASENRQKVDLGATGGLMPHRYKVREIAQQSGLSEATVDRLPNWPPGVRENTRAEVMQATVDRDKQRCPAGPGRPSATSSTLSCGHRSGSPTPSGPRSRPNCVYSRLPWCPRFHLWELDAADGAGVTAAHLMNQWLGPSSPDASITLSRTVFRGEGGPAIVEVSDSDGIDATNERLMFDALETHPTIEAVYSVGGGNTAMVAEVEAVPCLYCP